MIRVQIDCALISKDFGYCHGTRVAFDSHWAVYVVNGDTPMPYYRVHVNDKCVGIVSSEQRAYNLLLKLKPEDLKGVIKDE